jgi:hypothetical protein
MIEMIDLRSFRRYYSVTAPKRHNQIESAIQQEYFGYCEDFPLELGRLSVQKGYHIEGLWWISGIYEVRKI